MIRGKIFKGTLSLASGDNLGSHYIGGFKAPSGSLWKCRQCLAVDDNMKTQVGALFYVVYMLDLLFIAVLLLLLIIIITVVVVVVAIIIIIVITLLLFYYILLTVKYMYFTIK